MAAAMRDVGGDFFWQSYQVTTPDGYVLTQFRITGDPEGQPVAGQGSKGPLLLQHGFLTDSITWLSGLTDESELAIVTQLFLAGYDVWLGNIRGSRNSRVHQRYDPDLNACDFWDFSYEEFGHVDMPSMLWKIKEVQAAEGSCKKISYVGHS